MELDPVVPIRFGRERLAALVARIPAAVADDVPPGSRNNLRWQLGHIICVTERVALGMAGAECSYPAEWLPYFAPGSAAEGFDGGTPSWPDLVTALELSTEHLAEVIPTLDVNAPLAKPFTPGGTTFTIERVAHALVLAPIHDAVHMGTMGAYFRLLSSG